MHPCRRLLHQKLHCSGPLCKCLAVLPPFVNHNLVGAQIALEMLEHLQETVQDREVIPLRIFGHEIVDFVQKDMFYVGLTMEAVFQVDFKLCISKSRSWLPDHGIRTHAWMQDDKQVQEAANALRSIQFRPRMKNHPLKDPRKLEVVVQYHTTIADMKRIMQILGPCLFELYRKGFDISLTLQANTDVTFRFRSRTWKPRDYARCQRKNTRSRWFDTGCYEFGCMIEKLDLGGSTLL